MLKHAQNNSCSQSHSNQNSRRNSKASKKFKRSHSNLSGHSGRTTSSFDPKDLSFSNDHPSMISVQTAPLENCQAHNNNQKYAAKNNHKNHKSQKENNQQNEFEYSTALLNAKTKSMMLQIEYWKSKHQELEADFRLLWDQSEVLKRENYEIKKDNDALLDLCDEYAGRITDLVDQISEMK